MVGAALPLHQKPGMSLARALEGGGPFPGLGIDDVQGIAQR